MNWKVRVLNGDRTKKKQERTLGFSRTLSWRTIITQTNHYKRQEYCALRAIIIIIIIRKATEMTHTHTQLLCIFFSNLNWSQKFCAGSNVVRIFIKIANEAAPARNKRCKLQKHYCEQAKWSKLSDTFMIYMRRNEWSSLVLAARQPFLVAI